MKATVLIDNIKTGELISEWGLSIYIEYKDKKILLDTGASDFFYRNAKLLGVDLRDIEYAVLSHAHFDHANGIDTFFKHNNKANLYLRKGSKENCYERKWIFSRYIGIKKGTLLKYKDRIVYADKDFKMTDGVMLVPHKTEGLSFIGKKNNMYKRENRKWYPDDFSHEQSLVFDTEKGLVIFNSCSHGGADNIINEISDTFKNKKIYAIIGGFHLYTSSEKEVRALADRIRKTGIQKIYTGHCTGNKAFKTLKEELNEKIEQFNTGMVMEF